jgi:thiosulfate dehydrogenase [quinone] large subunit
MLRTAARPTPLANSPVLDSLFSNPAFAPIWLVVRLFVGYQWITSGWGKLNSADWMSGGVALKGFWERAVAIPAQGRPVITFDWYRSFLSFLLDGGHYVWFAKLITFGEMLIGLALILGAFVGIAAFFGGFMNFYFLMAGTASTNPVLLVLSILMVIAWRIAGYYGLDRWILPALARHLEWLIPAAPARYGGGPADGCA